MTKRKIDLPEPPEPPEVCHGCGGRGWVDSQTQGAQKCPICGGCGVIEREQLGPPKFWKVITYHIPK